MSGHLPRGSLEAEPAGLQPREHGFRRLELLPRRRRVEEPQDHRHVGLRGLDVTVTVAFELGARLRVGGGYERAVDAAGDLLRGQEGLALPPGPRPEQGVAVQALAPRALGGHPPDDLLLDQAAARLRGERVER